MYSTLNFTLFSKYFAHFNFVQRVEAYIIPLSIVFTDIFNF